MPGMIVAGGLQVLRQPGWLDNLKVLTFDLG